ncbi:oxidoreductase [Microbacterium murale]|uniref:Oxidoreductase n=1 Tax=Microbacterium murale TaxID=1081040 RepID=A0ABQ1RXB0_9MICO|nr:oxidoreductase [Microbacterium murale]
MGIGWAGQQHIQFYDSIDGVEVVALAGMETALLGQLAEQYRVTRTYADWADLIREGGLDVLSIALPTAMHAPVAIAALEAGIHVLTEKPMANNAAAAQSMVDAARANGRVLDVAFNFRRRGEIAALRRAVDDGLFGRLYTVKASWLRRSGIPGLGTWFTDPERAGGGPMIDIGVHVLDYTLHVLGEPEVLAVNANTYAEFGTRGRGGMKDLSRAGDFEVEDYAVAMLRLEGGGTALVEASWALLREEEDELRLVLYGTEAGADVVLRQPGEPGSITIYRDDAEGAAADDLLEFGAHGGHERVVSDFVAKVRAGDSRWARHDGSEALARTRVIDAIYRSASEGREVRLDEAVTA